MKKTLAIIASVAVAGMATADLSVDFQNLSGVYTVGGGFTSANYVQLIWNDGSNLDSGSGVTVNSGTLVGNGGVELASTVADAGFAGTFGLIPGLYTDADVGGTISSGYLTVRIFPNGAPVAGDVGAEFAVDVDGSLTVFDPLTPSTTYDTASSFTGGELGGLVSGTAGTVTVIPEPATIGLMGVAGLGMFLARRKARR